MAPSKFNSACERVVQECELGEYAPASRQSGPSLVPWDSVKEWLDTGPSPPSRHHEGNARRSWEGKIYGRGEQTTVSLLRLLRQETDTIDLIFLSCPPPRVSAVGRSERAWRYVLYSLLFQLRAYQPTLSIPRDLSQLSWGMIVAVIRSWLRNLEWRLPQKKVLIVLDRFHRFIKPAPHPSGDYYKHLDHICVLLHRTLQARVLWITNRVVDDHLTIDKKAIGGEVIEAERMQQMRRKRRREEADDEHVESRPAKRVKCLLEGDAIIVRRPRRNTVETIEQAPRMTDEECMYMLRQYTYFPLAIRDLK